MFTYTFVVNFSLQLEVEYFKLEKFVLTTFLSEKKIPTIIQKNSSEMHVQNSTLTLIYPFNLASNNIFINIIKFTSNCLLNVQKSCAGIDKNALTRLKPIKKISTYANELARIYCTKSVNRGLQIESLVIYIIFPLFGLGE